MMQANDASGDRNTASAGEAGTAGDLGKATAGSLNADVIVGEIPEAGNLAHMLWTARCTWNSHGLLGTYAEREMAEEAGRQHLSAEHDSR
jgi:hypothetical protein